MQQKTPSSPTQNQPLKVTFTSLPEPELSLVKNLKLIKLHNIKLASDRQNLRKKLALHAKTTRNKAYKHGQLAAQTDLEKLRASDKLSAILYRKQLLASAHSECLALVISLVQKFIRDIAKPDQHYLEQEILDGLERLQDLSSVVLLIHPDSAYNLSSEALNSLGLKVLHDTTLKPTSARLKTNKGEIEVDWEQNLTKFLELVQQQLKLYPEAVNE